MVTPYYNKPNRAGLRAHFEAVAEAAGDTPVILYNIPSRCGDQPAPDFLAELAAGIDNVVAVKQANDDELGPIEGLDVLAGNDDGLPALPRARGAPVASWSARTWSGPEMRAIYEAARRATRPRPRDRRRASADLRGDDGDRNPIPVKAALEMLGIIEGHLRLPMVPAERRGAGRGQGGAGAAGAPGRRRHASAQMRRTRRGGSGDGRFASCRSAGSARSART